MGDNVGDSDGRRPIMTIDGEAPLFTFVVPSPPAPEPGNLRTALETDLERAVTDARELPALPVAILRSLADQADALENRCRDLRATSGDRSVFARLMKHFEASYVALFGASSPAPAPAAPAADSGSEEGGDPFADALERFANSPAGNPPDGNPV